MMLLVDIFIFLHFSAERATFWTTQIRFIYYIYILYIYIIYFIYIYIYYILYIYIYIAGSTFNPWLAREIHMMPAQIPNLWLVVDLPLWKIWKSMGRIIPYMKWKIKMFETTNQYCVLVKRQIFSLHFSIFFHSSVYMFSKNLVVSIIEASVPPCFQYVHCPTSTPPNSEPEDHSLPKIWWVSGSTSDSWGDVQSYLFSTFFRWLSTVLQV